MDTTAAAAPRPMPFAPDTYERVLAGGAVVLLGAAVVAVIRGRGDWAGVPATIWLHLATIGVALALTPVMMLRPRGDARHRVLGIVWVAAMLLTAAISLAIHTTNPGGFSIIHILSVWVLLQVPLLWWTARTHRVARHRRNVRGLVTGALLIAGFFTFPFDRLLGHWAVGLSVRGRLRIGLFTLVWFSCSWFGSWELNANTATRLFAAVSLVEQHDATIDEFAGLTIDKAMFGGHVYLDKAPGMTLMALPAVAIGDWVTGQRATTLAKFGGQSDFARYLRLRLRIAVATGPAILTAIGAVLILDLGTALAGSAAGGLAAAIAFALGTPIWGWSTTLLGHAPVAALYVIAVWAVWRGTRDGIGGTRWAVLAGASLGWAVVVEYQSALAGGAIALWASWRYARSGGRRWWALAAAAIGGLAALIPLGLYNITAFDTPFRIGYSGVVGWEGMRRGLFGLGWPDPRALLEITFGPTRGLFWVAPILVLAPRGLSHWWSNRARREWAVLLGAVTVITLLVNAAYVYWDGGNSTGPRLAMPMAGTLALGLAPLWAALASRAQRIGTLGLLALSVFLNLAIASADIFAPPMFSFPIWSDVLAGRFAAGALQTIASDWWGWSPWAGLAAWAIVALPALIWLARTALSAYPDHRRVTGASGSPQGSAA